MALVAYAPTGKRIVSEYWLRPYTAPVTFERAPTVPGDEDFVVAGIAVVPDYSANQEGDTIYHMEKKWNALGFSYHETLRWQDEDEELWPTSALTFKEENE